MPVYVLSKQIYFILHNFKVISVLERISINVTFKSAILDLNITLKKKNIINNINSVNMYLIFYNLIAYNLIPDGNCKCSINTRGDSQQRLYVLYNTLCRALEHALSTGFV